MASSRHGDGVCRGGIRTLRSSPVTDGATGGGASALDGAWLGSTRRGPFSGLGAWFSGRLRGIVEIEGGSGVQSGPKYKGLVSINCVSGIYIYSLIIDIYFLLLFAFINKRRIID